MKKYVFLVFLVIISGCNKYEETEFGRIKVNRDGEYIIEDWNIYKAIFQKAINTRDRELLSKLCRQDVYVDVHERQGYQSYGNPRDWEKYNYRKRGVEKVDLDILETLFIGEGEYESHTNRGKLIQEYYFPRKNVRADQYKLIFQNFSNGAGWDWLSMTIY